MSEIIDVYEQKLSAFTVSKEELLDTQLRVKYSENVFVFKTVKVTTEG